MRCVTWRVERTERPSPDVERTGFAQDPESFRRNGFHGSEQRRHALLAVDPRGAGHQPGRIRQMARAAFVHPDGRVRESAGQRSHPARVIQVDVREHDVCERVGCDAERLERAGHGLDGCARAGFHQRRFARRRGGTRRCSARVPP